MMLIRTRRGTRPGKAEPEPWQAVGAVQVEIVQDTGAVTGASGDFGGRPAGVQPQGQGGVAQVVGAAGQHGGGQFRPKAA